MGKLGSIVGALAAGTAVLAPIQQAAACSYTFSDAIVRHDYVNEGRLRRVCAGLGARDQGFLREVARGRYHRDDILTIANAFREGEYGCARDPGYGLLMWSAFLPDPLTVDADRFSLSEAAAFAVAHRGQVRRERYRDIVGLDWLFAPDGPSLAEQGWSHADVDRFLVQPDRLRVAIDYFGVKRERDEAVFRLLADPASAAFDRGKAAELALVSKELPDKRLAATLVLDPRLGAPDVAGAYEVAAGSRSRELQAEVAAVLLEDRFGAPGLEAAQALLAWHSPYVHFDDEPDRSAALSWQSIAGRLAASEDPVVRARGEAIRLTGDPRASAAAVLPQIPDLVVLDHWPQGLPEIADWVPDRWAQSYPARAMRDDRGGRAEAGLLFGPDGGFQEVWISRSSGSPVLDKATADLAARYLRPRLSELRLSGYPGRHVIVPLGEVEWHIASRVGPGSATFKDGTLVVTGERRAWADSGLHC